MSTQQFRVTNFKPETLAKIEQAASIIAEYDGQKLTARQVYYQFVARDLIPNNEKSYKAMTNLLTDARYAGMISWDAIEDRGREPDVPSEWESIDELVDAAVAQWRSPRWRDQPKYVELWVEKQALAGVLGPIARRAHVPLMVNKGYSSASAMKASAERMLTACGVEEIEVQCDNCAGPYEDRSSRGKCNNCEAETGRMFRWQGAETQLEEGEMKDVVVLYLGDHDPSGNDMVRDIKERLTEFGVPNLTVTKIGLTMAQIRRFKPPPNPAKLTDARAKGYIEEFGDQSWELDALPPRELNRLVEASINANMNRELMNEVIRKENNERERVRIAIEKSRSE